MPIGTQMLASAMLMVMMTLVHGLGIIAITRLLRLEAEALKVRPVDVAAFGLIVAIALALFLLHLLEIALFALFYLGVGALGSLEEALFFSASSYATLANTMGGFPVAWRLVGAIEGLIGFLLIAWSAAVFVSDVNLLLRSR